MTIKRFEELNIWIDAKILTLEIYSQMKGNNDYGYREQIQRASVSIMNNIAEGFESCSSQQFIKYLGIAKGSCGEVRSMLLLGEDLKYIPSSDVKSLINLSVNISRGIAKLIDYLKSKKG